MPNDIVYRISKVLSDGVTPVPQELYLRARTVLDAMREPTESMLDAAYDNLDWGPGGVDAEATPSDAWRVMIDAALSEEPAPAKTASSVERKYSVSEIDKMRTAIASWGFPNAVSYDPTHRAQEIEDRLRTYMAAGVDPKSVGDEVHKHWLAMHPKLNQRPSVVVRATDGKEVSWVGFGIAAEYPDADR